MSRPSLLPVSKKRYRITLWLHPAEYWALMHASAMLGGGKISFHKWFKKQAAIENAKVQAESHKPELAALTRSWGKFKRNPPVQQAKRNSPRRLAA